MIIWLVSGVILVSLTYLLSPHGINPWPALHAAGTVAAAYFLALVGYATRKPFPRKTKMAIWSMAVIFAGSAALFSTMFDATTSWQQRQLQKILTFIHRGIFADQLPPTLLQTLERYHAQRPLGKKSIGTIFRELVPKATAGMNIHAPESEDDNLKIYVASISDREVVLIGQPMHGKGRDPAFKNYSGQKGLVQERATLTERGIAYESEN